MTYKEKAEKLREMVYKANGLEYPPKTFGDHKPISCQKWKSVSELSEYLESWGGSLKSDARRRKGFLIVPLQDETIYHNAPLVAEVPMDFAMKVMVMGEFP